VNPGDMARLAHLAGWYTVPDPRDLLVVRTAINVAKVNVRTQAEQDELADIEDRWLEEVL
jgi:hypothetical protein